MRKSSRKGIRVKLVFIVCGVLFFLLGIVSVLWAKEKNDSVERNDPPATQLQEILVTATELSVIGPPSTSSRLGLTPLETPASIHIIDNVELKKDGYNNVAETIEHAPGVTWGAPPAQPFSLSMRGFTENQVTILRDGIWLGPASMMGRPQSGFNLSRIELLKGPASVLHGQGTIAGTLNMVTKRPSMKSEMSWENLVSYGRYNTIKLGSGIGGQLHDTLWYRADISRSSSDGYVDNADPRSLDVTTSLLWSPFNDMEVRIGFDYLKDRLPNYWGTPLVTKDFATKPLKGVVETTDGRTIDKRMRFENYNVANEKANSHQYFTHFDIDWKLNSSISLKNTFYYFDAERRWRNAETYTFDATTNLIGRDRFFVSHDQQTVGNRLYGTFNNDLVSMANRSLVGVDFSYVDFTRRSRFFGNVDSVDPFNPDSGRFSEPDETFLNPTKITTVAVFVEDTLEVTSRLRLVAALRQDFIRLNRDSYNLDGSFNSTNAFERTFRPFSWRLGLVYEFDQALVGYAQWTSGADPVGSNIFLVNGNQDFDLTKAQQWEVGMKSEFFDNRANITLALYHIERKDILVATGSGGQVDNVGKQQSSGLELETAFQATPHWSLGGNAAYTYAEFKSFGANTGNRPANVPRWVVNGWTNYRDILGLPFEVGGRFRHVSDRFNNNANTVTLMGYEIVDLHLAYHEGPVRILGRVSNLFDEEYAYWGDTFYPDQVLLGPPRTYEINLQIDF